MVSPQSSPWGWEASALPVTDAEVGAQEMSFKLNIKILVGKQVDSFYCFVFVPGDEALKSVWDGVCVLYFKHWETP